MNVLFLTAEMSPLVKVGGLADVAGALPRALRRLGLDVRVALPMYATLGRDGLELRRVGSTDDSAVYETRVYDVPVYLIEHAPSFERDRVYGFDDDLDRYLSFCDAVLASSDALGWSPDVLHLHDWHAGFLAMRLRGLEGVAAARPHPWIALPRVLTIHNLGHTGAFTWDFIREHDLWAIPASNTRSVLAQAIFLSHAINAVSPTYAKEILIPRRSGSLADMLIGKRHRLSGILNGIDTELFDPSTDPHLAARFDADQLDARKENKLALQKRLGLDVDRDVPLIGMVTRLFDQKGTDLVPDAIEPLLAEGQVQLVVLGQGDADHQDALRELSTRHPGRAAVALAFDEPLGQLIYGGSDIFLMPSRYEPCGLGQMIAMRYGAIPLVRRTGGLADSVPPYNAASDSGTGFLFNRVSSRELAAALRRAIAVYHDTSAWRALQLRAMAQDVSWDRSAREYVEMYERAVVARKEIGAKRR